MIGAGVFGYKIGRRQIRLRYFKDWSRNTRKSADGRRFVVLLRMYRRKRHFFAAIARANRNLKRAGLQRMQIGHVSRRY